VASETPASNLGQQLHLLSGSKYQATDFSRRMNWNRGGLTVTQSFPTSFSFSIFLGGAGGLYCSIR
jgi:hypothetical protein